MKSILCLFLTLLCLPVFSQDDAHSSNKASRRAVGPLKTQLYNALVQRPEVHGYSIIELTRADGSGIDSFKVRQTVELTTGAPETVFRDVKRVVNARDVDVQDFVLVFEGEGESEGGFTVMWREAVETE